MAMTGFYYSVSLAGNRKASVFAVLRLVTALLFLEAATAVAVVMAVVVGMPSCEMPAPAFAL
jgi:K+-transporting ATPase A subunit